MQLKLWTWVVCTAPIYFAVAIWLSYAKHPALITPATAGRFDSSSPIILYEDDKPLGPAHSTPHSEISSLGHGRFSHWKANHSIFVFSSSDNTDPRTNGRTYWAVRPPMAVKPEQ